MNTDADVLVLNDVFDDICTPPPSETEMSRYTRMDSPVYMPEDCGEGRPIAQQLVVPIFLPFLPEKATIKSKLYKKGGELEPELRVLQVLTYDNEYVLVATFTFFNNYLYHLSGINVTNRNEWSCRNLMLDDKHSILDAIYYPKSFPYRPMKIPGFPQHKIHKLPTISPKMLRCTSHPENMDCVHCHLLRIIYAVPTAELDIGRRTVRR